MVAQTRGGGQPSPNKLKFHDKLLAKNTTTDALQKKLKALYTELQEMDQDNVDTSSLSAVKKELISTSILLHKDRGVKAYAACCLADLLRLYAPDAPYTQAELRDIFQFFFRQLLSGLKGPDVPYYTEYFHLLDSLSTVKSVVLVCDLPNADDLMVEVFRAFFTLMRNNLPKKLEIFMSDILIAILEECHSISADVLDTLLAQYMDKNTTSPAYRLAVSVCNATADKLQRHVCQHFTDIIVTHARDEDFEEMQTAHELIKRINHASPALLHNVVPQLEEELRVQEVSIRVVATQTLGEMFADKNGADFAKKYPSTWTAWLARRNDQATAVRLAFVEVAKGVLVNMTLAEQREQVEEALQTKLLDPDEKVRAAVCRLYTKLDYETALHHVSEQQLRNIAGRGVDKKPSVQAEAMKAVARLYNLAYSEIERSDPAAVQQFSWIPQAILMMSTTSKEVKMLADQMLSEYILPLPAASSSSGKTAEVDEVAWTERLLCTMKFLDAAATNLLLSLSGIRAPRPTAYERYLQSCIDNNGGVIDKDEKAVKALEAQLSDIIKRIASTYADPQRAADDLNAFAKLNDPRLYKLLKTCMDSQTDIKTVVKSTNEFVKRLDQSSSNITSTMTVLLRRVTLRIASQSSIPTLIKRVQKGLEGDAHALAARHAKTWLVYMSKHNPAMYKLHVAELTKAIADERNRDLVEVSLQALSAVSVWDNSLAPSDKRTLERLQNFALASDYRHAKFAARLLAVVKNREKICAGIVDSIAEALPEDDPDELVSHIAVLAQFATRATEAFERQSDKMIKFLLKQVIMTESPADEDDMEVEEWVNDAHMSPDLRAKLFALKACRNRCLAHADSADGMEIAKPVLRMLFAILQHGGSLSADAVDDPKTKTRLRLQAAVSLLHLASVPKFAEVITPNFIYLAIAIQDPCYQVRLAFVTKLAALLTARKLPPAYNIILFLTPHDPEADIINTAKAYVAYVIRNMPKQIRLENFEIIFIRLLHTLAHHPDFVLSEEAVPEITKYIEFYLDLVCTADNVSLLYYLAVKTKMSRDPVSHTYSENVYAASEIAQYIVKARAKSHGWALESYPGHHKLPGDILRPLPSAEATNKILKNVYLPAGILKWLEEKYSKNAGDKKDDRRAAAKRKAAPKTNGHAKKSKARKRRKVDESDDDNEEESDEEDDDDEEEKENDEGGATAPERSPSVSGGEQESDKKGDQARPGRSARIRAQARIKQQTKKPNKGKGKMTTPDDDDD